MVAPLSIESIYMHCAPLAQHVAIRLVAETGSTNADLLAEVDHLGCPTLLVAEAQTAGRGRAGRSWHSEPGATLMFSLAWRFDAPAQALLGLPLAVGVAVSDALRRFDIEASLKWPNDILLDGRKLGGILVETASVGQSIWAVIGIGINMQAPDKLARQVEQPVATAPTLQADRNRSLAALLNSLAETLTLFEQRGFAAFRERWNALHAHAGQIVAMVEQDQVRHEGKTLGVDEIGRLLLDTAQGTVSVLAGDVSLRARS